MKNSIYALAFCLGLPGISQAATITFDFTGRLIVAGLDGGILMNNGSTYTPISASLTYDTATGLGSSGLSITMSDPFFGVPGTFHDITMTTQTGTNSITGEMFVDWGAENISMPCGLQNCDMPLHIVWDATGLLNAIDYGLQQGDILSGSTLYHDANGDHIQNIDEQTLLDLNSATPYSSILEDNYYAGLSTTNPDPQGPAPLAATSDSMGLGADTPFVGLRGYFDIGSGNSMEVVSISAVPIPAAIWLFGSGLLGLIGVARLKKAA
jgi:hypothetical protein